MSPTVSVIINCYNGERYLSETLASVKDQTFSDYELIFWDNCSTDETPRIAKTFDNRLRYFHGDTLISLGEARNKALEQVCGKYIAFIDSDDLWEPQKLEKQVKLMECHDDCGLVFSNFRRLNMLNGKTDVFYRDTEQKAFEFSDFVCEYSFSLSTFLIRHSVMKRLTHNFDDRLRYAEEYELFIRIAYYSKAIYMGEPLATYRIHSNMGTLNLQSRMAQEYEITLENLRKMIPSFDQQYPEVVRRINYLHDFSIAKLILPKGENKKVRQLMRAYLDYNIRAKCYYLAACLPNALSKVIFNIFYWHRV